MGMERPKLTPAIALIAARRIAIELAEAGHIDSSEIERSANHIAKHGGRRADGYVLAKALDDYEYWDCNLEMAELLDGYSYAVEQALGEAETEWAIEHKIQPPIPLGTTVQFGREKERGTLHAIYQHGAAKYMIAGVDADSPNSFRIVNFEDVTALEAEPA